MEWVTAGLVVVAMTAVLCYWVWNRLFGTHLHLPGPSILEVLKEAQIGSLHHKCQQWKEIYGDIVQLRFPGMNAVLLSGYPSIHEALITKGDDFAGRMESYSMQAAVGKDGIFGSQPDKKWKAQRKVASKHIKQYGDGMQRLEHIITEQATSLLQSLSESKGQEFNCFDTIFATVFDTISALVFGKCLPANTPLLKKMFNLHHMVTSVVVDPRGLILELIPPLRYSNIDIVKKFREVSALTNDVWSDITDIAQSLPDDSFVRVMLGKIHEGYGESNVKNTVIDVIGGGVTTTTHSLYALINILIHYPDVKLKLEREIFDKVGSSCMPTLKDRSDMPYTRAVLLEHMRYHSLVPITAMRKTTRDTSICGNPLPQGTGVIFNLYALHHDEKFWENSWEFQPDRFLDESGDVVLPDHPNRRHLFSFSGGPRICPGEHLGMARIFIWLVAILQRFDIQPGKVDVTCDVREYKCGLTLHHPPYLARFISRTNATNG